MGVLRDMAASLLVTEPVAMELFLPLVEVWSNCLTAQIVSSLRSFSSLPVSLATLYSSIFPYLLSLLDISASKYLSVNQVNKLHHISKDRMSSHPILF